MYRQLETVRPDVLGFEIVLCLVLNVLGLMPVGLMPRNFNASWSGFCVFGSHLGP